VTRSNTCRGETRTNALWGSGPRDDSRKNALWGRGGKRANALWGRGGRGLPLLLAALAAVVIPLGAVAKNPGSKGEPTIFQAGLLDLAKQQPNQQAHLIIQAQDTSTAVSAFTGAENDAVADETADTPTRDKSKVKTDASGNHLFAGDNIYKQLTLVGSVAVDAKAKVILKLRKTNGLIVTSDAPVQTSGALHSSKQMWPYASGASKLWGDGGGHPDLPTGTIAFVDSGIDATRGDFGGRVYPQVNMTTLSNNSPGDGRGHGTFVASIAAGNAPGYAGVAPTAKILPIDVMNDTGVARTSDVIAACAYLLANKSTYNIKVVNFSLHSGIQSHFYYDPLDRAVEKLWFNGIVVVAAAGNYGSSTAPSGVMYSPGNDPFVITVGATDLGKDMGRKDDSAAPWSAWGYTEDGFAKPELGAPGRYMIGAVSANTTLAAESADHIVAPGYMELSGTSFAAPVVAGAAADILAMHPTWTPDQVKGALMLTAKPAGLAKLGQLGVGEVDIAAAARRSSVPNPNVDLNRFVSTSSTGGGLTFNDASWHTAAASDASWHTASWIDASWSTASWSTASWSTASFNDASWSTASWSTASWSDIGYEDAAELDAGTPPPAMDATATAALLADPDLAPTDPASVGLSTG
jgi:serine protease AprX